MSIELRPHQIKAIDMARPILATHGVVLLALEQRLGKTFCALSLADEIRSGGRVLFVTKKAAISSILADSEAMGCFGDGLVVTNYESLHKLTGGFSVVIVDECHRISSPKKPCKAAQQIRGICAGACKVILLSGTPAIESSVQWFNIFWATALGPWKYYGGGIMPFYAWFKVYGISEKIRIAGGVEVESYKRCRAEVADDVATYAVCMTQTDVGFKQQAEVVEHLIDDGLSLILGHKIKDDGLLEFYCGGVAVAENPAAILQKRAMICGGTVLSEEGKVLFTGSRAKIDFILERLRQGKQYAIFTQYIGERAFVAEALRDAGHSVGYDMDEFRDGEFSVFVGSIKRFAEGVDLSWLSGSMIIYSLTFSGSTYAQILSRMCNWNRTEPIKVHVLMVRGSVEEYIYKAVSSKQSFNESFYRKVGSC
jgi:hypothetical protein